MYKKLVKIDDWHFAEVDQVALRRIALDLRDQIKRKVPADNDQYEFYRRTLPVVEAAIRGEIVDSLDDDESRFVSGNYRHDKSEGFLPPEYDPDFTRAVSEFSVTVQGMPLSETEKIVKDGVTWAWAEFEEEGDWPDKVRYR